MTQKDLTGLGEINALLGRGTEYEGKLSFEGRVRIDGRFTGQIFSGDVLILGDGAELDADVEVGTLIVRGGVLRGTVRASQLVEIHVPGEVHADIHTPQLFVDKGVVFEGRCTMEDTQVHSLEDEEADEPPRGKRGRAESEKPSEGEPGAEAKTGVDPV
jgi:cytoskeletal protein CcmA (bactofilin family)